MSVTDLNSFREKKLAQQKAKLETAKENVSSAKVTLVNDVTNSNHNLFIREAMKFKFLNMSPPAAFACINTDKLPPAFPPDCPPPMAA